MLVYNEIKTVLKAYEQAKAIDVKEKEIIIVDNCSNDGTQKLLKNICDPATKIIFNDKNYGPGWSVKIGIELAGGEYIYIHHADLEYDYKIVSKMLSLAEKNNFDAVFGSRIKNYQNSKMQLIKKRPEYLATIIATGLINYWYQKNFTDVIGSKLYRTSSIRKIPINTYDTGFEFENVSRMCKNQFKIEEIGVDYQPRFCKKDKKIKPHNIINALLALFRVRFFE